MIDDPQAQPVPQGQARWADVAVTPAEVADRVFPLTPEVRRSIDTGTVALLDLLGRPPDNEET